jgi:hypothetical protein
MDFYQIATRQKGGMTEVYPDFTYNGSLDLMVRGKDFYAIWDEKRGLWSTFERDVPRLVDRDLREYARGLNEPNVRVLTMESSGTGIYAQYRRFIKEHWPDYVQLDSRLTFADQKVRKEDYASKRLPYSLRDGKHEAWDELMGILYAPDELRKIEWAIGSIVQGDSTRIQKFVVLYGPPKSGKSTLLGIIEQLFNGYCRQFDARALTSRNSQFSMEPLAANPLVAIQHDGDLSRIEDNTKLNSIISHDPMMMNEKYRAPYSVKLNTFLFLGTNQPVRIQSLNAGVVRRLIDVVPTGETIPYPRYRQLMEQIGFEMGAIAQHCLDVYRGMGPTAYDSYRPKDMAARTNPIYNFIEDHLEIIKEHDGIVLGQAWELWKVWCDLNGHRPGTKTAFRTELEPYFKELHDQIRFNGQMRRSVYLGYHEMGEKTEERVFIEEPMGTNSYISLSKNKKICDNTFDQVMAQAPAQYSHRNSSVPAQSWQKVQTRLENLDTSRVHFVQPQGISPIVYQLIVIDFDLRGEDGTKSRERNLEAAARWPPTYAEYSQGGDGVHLHYFYDGDIDRLSGSYSDGIEIKTFRGNAALRRKVTEFNDLPIATLPAGYLPEKKESSVLSPTTYANEASLRRHVLAQLRKETHPGTKPSVDFIAKILDDAYKSGMPYDLTDMKNDIVAFASNSTNQSAASLKIVSRMRFKSAEAAKPRAEKSPEGELAFFDVEVYPNLLVICWKHKGGSIVKMINPTPDQVRALMPLKLVGFNNRRYDNHILYARILGYSNEGLFDLSQRLIMGERDAYFGQAYDLSWADIYDFSSVKQTLKKWEIQLGLPHKEIDLPWDKPVPDNKIKLVVDYCCADVNATEATFEARHGDFVAREILAKLSGLPINSTTAQHTARIIFGGEKNPQSQFVYTDLSKEFNGYVFDRGVSTYRGATVGEGGYVYAEPGIYMQVAVLDIASMHPTSIERLNLFGPYTANFVALMQARLAIKHVEYDVAKGLLDGKLAQFLDGDTDPKALSDALKIVINQVYGLTSASFPNPFRDNRNKDNIVAKRGALFMIDLQHMLQERGVQVVHIKTDSVKIPGATPEVISAVIEFGAKYGYHFEHETTYDKMCLVNDAVYVAKTGDKWTAVGSQFQHPYVFKKMFSREDFTFDDFIEAKSVIKGAIYMDFFPEDELDLDRMVFVGRTGTFVPVYEGGATLYRVKDDKFYAVSGTKGYLWADAEVARRRGFKAINMRYFEKLFQDAVKAIQQFGDLDEFLN